MFATVDPVFRGRGWRNQYIPPITEENLQDNAYVNMKRGGKVVKKKGKTTASATAIVNVYTGRRGRRRVPMQPRPAPQINVNVQNPYPVREFESRSFAPAPSEPFGQSRMRDNFRDTQIRMEQIDTSRFLPFGMTKPVEISEIVSQGRNPVFDFDFSNFPVSQGIIPVPVRQQSEIISQPKPHVNDPFRLLPFNAEPYDPKFLKQQTEPLSNKYLLDYPHIKYTNLGIPPSPPPIKEQDGYEPYEPIEMKHEKEPDELIIMEQDLQPYEPYQLYTPPYYGSFPPSPRAEEEKAATAAGAEPVEQVRGRVRRTKEEIELAKQLQQAEKEEKQRRREQIKKLQQEQREDAQEDRLFRQIEAVRQEITDLQKQDENHPFLPQLRKRLQALTKK